VSAIGKVIFREPSVPKPLVKAALVMFEVVVVDLGDKMKSVDVVHVVCPEFVFDWSATLSAAAPFVFLKCASVFARFHDDVLCCMLK